MGEPPEAGVAALGLTPEEASCSIALLDVGPDLNFMLACRVLRDDLDFRHFFFDFVGAIMTKTYTNNHCNIMQKAPLLTLPIKTTLLMCNLAKISFSHSVNID